MFSIPRTIEEFKVRTAKIYDERRKLFHVKINLFAEILTGLIELLHHVRALRKRTEPIEAFVFLEIIGQVYNTFLY